MSIKPEEWEGIWILDDGALNIKVLDSQMGVAQVSWIENKEDNLILESHEIWLLEAGDWMFVSIRAEEDDQDENTGSKEKYNWARIKKEENRIVLWAPYNPKFRILVDDGTLPGSVDEDGNITLGDLTGDHLNLIASEKKGILFDWENPIFFERLTR